MDKAFDEQGWICFGCRRSPARLRSNPNRGKGSAGRSGNVVGRIQFTVSVSPDASGVHNNVAIVSGGGAENSDVDPIVIGDGVGQFGLIPSSIEGDTHTVERPDAHVEHQAGSHPFEQRVDFDLNQMYGRARPIAIRANPYTKSIGLVRRTVRMILPRDYRQRRGPAQPPWKPQAACRGVRILPDSLDALADTQVGYLKAQLSNGFFYGGWGFLNEIPRVAVYNLEPPKGVAADFGFKVGRLFLGHIYQTLDPSRDYAGESTAPFITDIEDPARTCG